jgi:hypothetical protein
MSDADFICYTSEREFDSLCKFFYEENGIDKSKLSLKVFDITKTIYSDLINKYKNIEETKKGDRCVETKVFGCENINTVRFLSYRE